MWSWIHKAGSPKICYRWAKRLQPWSLATSVVAFTYGLWGALYAAPADYQQGDVYRILFIHVPAAIMSLGVYSAMAMACLIYLIWKIKVADFFAKTCLTVGVFFTLITLITGSIWGRPTWGTFWIWDARLTSELLLLFIYLGILAARNAIPEPQLASKAAAIITLIGWINIPIIHYSVDWWHTLHQGATILKFSQPSIAPSMLHPLLAMIAAYFFYTAALLMMKLRAEILTREPQAQWLIEEVNHS